MHRHTTTACRSRSARAVLAVLMLAATVLGMPGGERIAHAAPLSPRMEIARSVAAEKLALTDATVPVDGYPFYTANASSWQLGGTTGWVNGFLPGSLWLHYQLTGDPAARDSALRRQATFAQHATRTNNHDLGFMFMSSYSNAYRLTGDPRHRTTLLTAASSLAQRYDPRVGMVRSTNRQEYFQVLADTMMNLELLFWGARSGGDPAWREMASSHALRAAQDFLRPDGGTYHYVAYNQANGAVLHKGQVQGYSTHSTWARGQAWIIHGMGIAFRETGDARFLDAARRASTYWTANVPEDFVPYWDFDAPNVPDEPRDSSAAAIAASAFVELAQLDPDRTWRRTYADLATATLESLSSPQYLAEREPLPAVLKHGTYAATIGASDHGTSWGDYYFRQALVRRGTSVERVGGPDRYHTSVRTSYSAFDASTAAVVASGDSYADALSASALAGALDAPLLLTASRTLPASVRAELVRLGVRDVYVVGGASAASHEVGRTISEIPGVRITRIAGSDRFATASRVAERVASLSGGTTPLVFVARADAFADALSGAPVAYAHGAPIVLTASATLPASAAHSVRSLRPERIVVLGGPRAISAEVVRQLKGLAPAATVVRIEGADRYETAVRFATWARTERLAGSGSIGVVSGQTFPDALGAGVAIGSQGGLLLMTGTEVLDRRAAAWLAGVADAATRVTVFGGESVVSGRAENQVRDCLPEQRRIR